MDEELYPVTTEPYQTGGAMAGLLAQLRSKTCAGIETRVHET